MLILIFSLLEQRRCGRIWWSLNLVQGSFQGASSCFPASLNLLWSQLTLSTKLFVYIEIFLFSLSGHIVPKNPFHNSLWLVPVSTVPLATVLCLLCLLPEGEVGCFHTNSAMTATMGVLSPSYHGDVSTVRKRHFPPTIMRSLCACHQVGRDFL